MRPRHKLLYLLQLSPDGELSVSPVRSPLAGVIGEVVPLPLSLLEQETPPNYLTDEDFRILHELAERSEMLSGLTWYPIPASADNLFHALIETGRCRWRSPEGPALRLGAPVGADVYWLLRQDGTQELRFDLADAGLAKASLQLPLRSSWALDPDTGLCRPLRPRREPDQVSRLRGLGRIGPDESTRIADQIRKHDSALPEPVPVRVETVQSGRPEPHVRLVNVRVGTGGRFIELPAAALSFRYGELSLPWDHEGGSKLLGEDGAGGPRQVLSAERDLAFEEQCMGALEDLGLVALAADERFDYQPGDSGLLVPERRDRLTEAWVDAQLGLQRLAARGWQVTTAQGLLLELVVPQRWLCRLARAGEEWTAVDLQVQSGPEHLAVLEALADWARQATPMLLQTVLEGRDEGRDVLLPVGRRVVAVPTRRVRRALTTLVELADPQQSLPGGRLRVRRARLAELARLEPAWTLVGDADLADTALRLDRLDRLSPLREPRGLNARLRDYQRYGLGWLQFLREAGFGGILADDMGLGKTIQTLAHILLEKQSGRLDRPALVVAPTSLMFNWRSEARRFAPELRVLLLHGPKRRGEFQWIEDADLVLTTYPLLVRDLAWLKKAHWHLLILDEAQAIKNARTRASRSARQLSARHRLCLTGTPLENNLSELWSQFDFLMPGLLGSDAQFRSHFRQPIEKGGDEKRRVQLGRRIRPFFLRRTKAEVAPELPAKTEIVRSVPLGGAQLRLYDSVRAEMLERVRKAFRVNGPERGRIVVLDALLRLRQICCDPRLLGGAVGAPSAKLALLMDLVPEMVIEGRRILLFSQFVSMLELIEHELTRHGIEYLKLTGQTQDRQAVVEAFQRGRAPVFLISLRAGGVGLNLTAADTVIHYDPWWNPAVEDQATDRAHRIGQDQKVFVYRLLTDNTIEDKIQQLQSGKRELIEGLLGGGGAIELSAADLEQLFAAE
ncbi:MAG: DEAD/DEAH box helicase [Wenzhouxiangella sp.]|nr:MAG: DEAD/DEAH box helicase [Wenzhouxiangella sp.]